MMAYRAAPPPTPPRVLVVRPQRAPTAAIFMALGTFFVCGIVYGAVQSVVEHGPGPQLLFYFGGVAFSSIFVLTGLHSWLLRVDLTLWEDGVLTLTWLRWPFRSRTTSVPIAEVSDVVLESDDGTSKVVVITKGGPIPLTGSATSDDLSGKVAEMKAFLRLG